MALLTLFTFSIDSIAQDVSQWVEVNGGQWSPSGDELNNVKKSILPSVIQNQIEHGIKINLMSSYVFQYQGQHINGTKLIKVNAFCHKSMGSKASEQWIEVKDGGSCFLGGIYDVESKKFISTFVNGVG